MLCLYVSCFLIQCFNKPTVSVIQLCIMLRAQSQIRATTNVQCDLCHNPGRVLMALQLGFHGVRRADAHFASYHLDTFAWHFTFATMGHLQQKECTKTNNILCSLFFLNSTIHYILTYFVSCLKVSSNDS